MSGPARKARGYRPRRVAITGSKGLVGRHLTRALRARGDEVLPLARVGVEPPSAASPAAGPSATSQWDPRAGEAPQPGSFAALGEGVDAVVHLAGEPIAAGRWTAARRRRIFESRDLGTRSLAHGLGSLATPPPVLISASAVGWYGNAGSLDAPLDEAAPPGQGFLAEVCRAWEAAAEPARAAGLRVVHPRIGVVLAPDGGALARMLPIWRLGLGGPVGSGRQPVSWIHVDDLVGLLLFALDRDDLAGPLNAVAPRPTTNRALSRALGRALRRPAVVPVPRLAMRIAFGEMGVEMLGRGAAVAPRRAAEAGFQWRYDTLDGALAQLV